VWGGQSWPQAGLPAGWTRWKASPQAEKPAPRFVWNSMTGKTSGITEFTYGPIANRPQDAILPHIKMSQGFSL